jgi:hypothetical protein
LVGYFTGSLAFTGETSMTSAKVWMFHCIIIRTSNEHYSFQRRRKRKKRKGTSNSIGVGSKLHKINKLSGIYIFIYIRPKP